MLQRTLAPSFFFFLSFYLPFLYLAYLHMIDQSKMPLLLLLLLLPLLLLLLLLLWCARVCTGVCERRHALVCGCGWVDVCGCGRVWVGVGGCGQLCRMNFQNFFYRIESLHQRTLIRILYEFFINDLLQYCIIIFCKKLFNIVYALC